VLNEAPTLMNAEAVQDLRDERASCTDDVPTKQGRSFDADDDDEEECAASLQVQDACYEPCNGASNALESGNDVTTAEVVENTTNNLQPDPCIIAPASMSMNLPSFISSEKLKTIMSLVEDKYAYVSLRELSRLQKGSMVTNYEGPTTVYHVVNGNNNAEANISLRENLIGFCKDLRQFDGHLKAMEGQDMNLHQWAIRIRDEEQYPTLFDVIMLHKYARIGLNVWISTDIENEFRLLFWDCEKGHPDREHYVFNGETFTQLEFVRDKVDLVAHMEVRKSSIPNSGNGLFALADIPPGAIVGTAEGQWMTIEEYAIFESDNPKAESIQSGGGVIVFSENCRMRMMQNNYKTGKALNVDASFRGRFITLGKVCAGEEFFVSYGPDYFTQEFYVINDETTEVFTKALEILDHFSLHENFSSEENVTVSMMGMFINDELVGVAVCSSLVSGTQTRKKECNKKIRRMSIAAHWEGRSLEPDFLAFLNANGYYEGRYYDAQLMRKNKSRANKLKKATNNDCGGSSVPEVIDVDVDVEVLEKVEGVVHNYFLKRGFMSKFELVSCQWMYLTGIMSKFDVKEDSTETWEQINDSKNPAGNITRWQQKCAVAMTTECNLNSFTILVSKLLKSEGDGAAQEWHTDVDPKIATSHKALVFIGNMDQKEYKLVIGTSIVTIKEGDGVLMDGDVFHAGHGIGHPKRLYMLLSSRQSLSDKQIQTVLESSMHLWLLEAKNKVPKYQGNYEESTVQVEVMDDLIVESMRSKPTSNKRARFLPGAGSQSTTEDGNSALLVSGGGRRYSTRQLRSRVATAFACLFACLLLWFFSALLAQH